MAPHLSVVVVAYDMARELPRTLYTLSSAFQRDIDASEYEVVVVDNGSPEPVDPALIDSFDGTARLVRFDPARPSPAHAANAGIDAARGATIGLIIDGARMASPGLLRAALLGSKLGGRSVIATPAWHLGAAVQNHARSEGYDQATEDALLETVDWRADGYRLFDIATLANSSGRGWFGPMGESSALFMHAALWTELSGLDESFELPGGGLMNHDLYRRACEAREAQLIVLLGEGTIHQFHGGATTSGKLSPDAARDEYIAIRGEAYRPPTNRPVFLGSLHQPLLPHLEHSVVLAIERQQRGRTMFGPSSV